MSVPRRLLALCAIAGVLFFVFWAAAKVPLPVVGWITLVGTLTAFVTALRVRSRALRLLQVGAGLNGLGVWLALVIDLPESLDRAPTVLVAVGLLLMAFGMRAERRVPA